MISPECLTDGWVHTQRERMHPADPGQIELAIHALDLICRLNAAGLPFVFKGGTSLLLHLSQPRRLSVDVDIVCTVAKGDFDRVLDEICRNGPYLNWEDDERGANRIPRRRHYKVFYPSSRGPDGRQRVIIDVLEDECPIRDVVERPVQTSFVETQSISTVNVPSVNALLADKLTAFAPQTVGVKLTERYAQQVTKQMFDVGELFLSATDLQAVRSSYEENHAAEAGYVEQTRGERFSREASLQDTIQTAFQFCHHTLRRDPFIQSGERELMLQGIGQMANLMIGTRFDIHTAKIHAARAATVAAHLYSDRDITMEELRYLESRDLHRLRDCSFPESHKILQRLRAQPEALYHWWKICSLPS